MKTILLFIKLAWRGDLKLWQVFWIGKVGVSAALALISMALVSIFQSPFPALIYSCFMPFYLVFIFVSLWRCAPNTSNKFWMYLTRAYIVIGLLAVVFGFCLVYFGTQASHQWVN